MPATAAMSATHAAGAEACMHAAASAGVEIATAEAAAMKAAAPEPAMEAIAAAEAESETAAIGVVVAIIVRRVVIGVGAVNLAVIRVVIGVAAVRVVLRRRGLRAADQCQAAEPGNRAGEQDWPNTLLIEHVGSFSRTAVSCLPQRIDIRTRCITSG